MDPSLCLFGEHAISFHLSVWNRGFISLVIKAQHLKICNIQTVICSMDSMSRSFVSHVYFYVYELYIQERTTIAQDSIKSLFAILGIYEYPQPRLLG